MQWQHDRPFFEKSVHFPLYASAAAEGASFQGPEKIFSIASDSAMSYHC